MKRILGAVAVAALFSAAPALAATSMVEFTGKALVNGVNGNARTFTSTDKTVNVRATAWS